MLMLLLLLLLRLLQQIMKDKWINYGFDGEELKPHTEPEDNFNDTSRIGESLSLSYLYLQTCCSPTLTDSVCPGMFQM